MLFVGQLVKTPYGEGIVKEVRAPNSAEESIVVEPTTWVMDRGQKATFYMSPKDVHPKFPLGATISCPFGEGVVMDVRQDGIYVVHHKGWKLATGKSPVLFLNQSSVSAAAKNSEQSPPKISVAESCIKNCISAKDIAKRYFQKADYSNAKEHYITALSCLRYLEENLTNDEKAAVFAQHIPCHNNVALCAFKLKEFKESATFANNSFMLIEALVQRMPNSEVWKALQMQGVSLEQLLEWRRKSLYYISKSSYAMGEYDRAKDTAEEALKSVAPDDTQVLAELTDLKNRAANKLAEEIKKAKATWGKAFKKSANEQLEDAAAASASTGTPANSTNSGANSPVKAKKGKKLSKKGDADAADKGDKNDFQISDFIFSPYTFGILALGGLSYIGYLYFNKNRRTRLW